MPDIKSRLECVRGAIAAYEHRHGRPAGAVTLVAIGKSQSAARLAEAYAAGQRHFGENYLHEAQLKMKALAHCAIQWHYTGAIQSNKTRPIAEGFHWVQSLDRLKIAQRLSEQRPAHLPPLNVCIQVNIGNEPQKAGAGADEVADLLREIQPLPCLRVRGLMAIPPYRKEFSAQRAAFRALREIYERMVAQGYELDTLSMGMSADMEAAIAEGATMVRIGTAIFGERRQPQ